MPAKKPKPEAQLDPKLWQTNPQAAWVILVAAGWDPPGEYADGLFNIRTDHWHDANGNCTVAHDGELKPEQALRLAWRRFVRLSKLDGEMQEIEKR